MLEDENTVITEKNMKFIFFLNEECKIADEVIYGK